ncbi:MAG: hypothetical protein GY754_08025, partial [bacterium]|nr:hypothetical protein [bacterium]
EILLKEISMLYEGKEPAPLRLQYIDYVQWHRKMMKDNESFRKQEAY